MGYESNRTTGFVAADGKASKQRAGAGSGVFDPLETPGGEKNLAAANGSIGSPVNFDYFVPSGRTFYWSALTVYLRDNDNILIDRFGGGPALANGCLIQVINAGGSVEGSFGTDEVPLTDNGRFGLLAPNGVTLFPGVDEGEGPGAVLVGWLIPRSIGGRELSLEAEWRVRFVVRDNLTFLSEGRVVIQGRLELPLPSS